MDAHNRSIHVISVRHRQIISDAITRTDRRSSKTQGLWMQFRVQWSCPLSVSWVSKDKEVVQSVSLSVSQQWSDPWNDHWISKQSIASLDILITLTLYKLARLLSGAVFCLCDPIYFQTQPRYTVCKSALFGCNFAHWNWEGLKPGFRCQNSITGMHLLYGQHFVSCIHCYGELVGLDTSFQLVTV